MLLGPLLGTELGATEGTSEASGVGSADGEIDIEGDIDGDPVGALVALVLYHAARSQPLLTDVLEPQRQPPPMPSLLDPCQHSRYEGLVEAVSHEFLLTEFPGRKKPVL